HTRSDRDWSSDVCSSDLAAARPVRLTARAHDLGAAVPARWTSRNRRTIPQDKCAEETDPFAATFRVASPSTTGANLSLSVQVTRSEERRVGKGCRTEEWR